MNLVFNVTNRFLSIAILSAGVLLQACSSQVYNNKSYLETHDLSGKRVAILPVEVEFTGRLPRDYSLEKKLSKEETESVAIQNQLYSEYLFHARKSSKKKKMMELIPVDQINNRLHENGITTRVSWRLGTDSLARLLGADMVLRARVKKDRFMSESLAFGIDVASRLIDLMISKDGESTFQTETRTYAINLEATLTDVNTGTVVTAFANERYADWHRSPESIIGSFGSKLVRHGVVYVRR